MLLVSINKPLIQDFLSDMRTRTTHQLVEIVAVNLSHKKINPSSNYIYLATKEDERHYKLCQLYGGAAENLPQRYKTCKRGSIKEGGPKS